MTEISNRLVELSIAKMDNFYPENVSNR